MPYGWIITGAYDGEKRGAMGPFGISPEMIAKLESGEGLEFQLLDDDDELMYSGRFIGDADSEDAFGPLEDYGTPMAGCTTIKYWRGAKWEEL